jgi:integral membrane sensor domain MASE1
MRRWVGGRPVSLDHLVDVRALVLIAGPVSALASATVGVTTLFLTGALPEQSRFASALGLWWAGDYLGALVVAPVLLTWAAPSEGFVGRRNTAELILFAGGCILLAELALGRLFPPAFVPSVI